MVIKANDSRRSMFKDYLDNLTQDVTTKQWMMPAMVFHLKGCFSLDEKDAEIFCQEWLDKKFDEALEEMSNGQKKRN